MTEPRRVVVATWYGAFLVADGRIEREYRAPSEESELQARAQLRREGKTTPEEDRLLRELGSAGALTRDRRLAGPLVRIDRVPDSPEAVGGHVPDPELHRRLLLEEADAALVRAWDPSIHVDEAVRSLGELDHVHNLLSERLSSWNDRDGLTSPGPTDSVPDANAVAALPTGDPELLAARARLQATTQAVAETRRVIERAIESSVPRRSPNLNALLGPLLAAKIVSLGGGLDRLSRLPASTIQVLGAERAFFEHLRGRAPPPRHGALFLHAQIQSAPKRSRGKLARALAGKVAIAARLDRAGRPVDPKLAAAFTQRAEAIRKERGVPRRERRTRGSRLPLHRAAEDR